MAKFTTTVLVCGPITSEFINSTKSRKIRVLKDQNAWSWSVLISWSTWQCWLMIGLVFSVGIELEFDGEERFGLLFLIFPIILHSLLLFILVLMYILTDILNNSD